MHSGLERGGTQNRVDWKGPLKAGHRSRRLVIFAVIGLAVLAVIAAIVIWRHGKTTQVAGPPMVPVTVAASSQHDVPIYYDALGTVAAYNTVAIRAQVTGQLISVDFRQGQEVRQGDVLARIDPAPLKAALDQAVARKADDQAQLVDAQKDFTRFTTLQARNFDTQQNVDLQQAKVDHFKASIDADQGAIEAAQTQLGLYDDHGADRRRRRLSPGRRRQHHPYHRCQSAHGADSDQAVHGDFHAAAERSRPGARSDAARQRLRPRLRSERQRAAGRRPLAADRQSDRPDHQHDPAEGGISQRGRAAVAGRVRPHPHPDHDLQGCRDRSAGRGAARPRRLLCLGGQTRQHGGATSHRRADGQRRHRDRQQGPCRRRAAS